MTLKLLEEAIDALADYIKDNLEAKITALNTEYDDSLLTIPKAYYLGNVPDEIPEYPSICLQGDGFTLESQTAYTLENDYTVNIFVYVGDQDAETRFRKLCRYARAIVELLNSGEATYGYTHFINDKISISDTLSSPYYLQAVMIPVALKKAEDY